MSDNTTTINGSLTAPNTTSPNAENAVANNLNVALGSVNLNASSSSSTSQLTLSRKSPTFQQIRIKIKCARLTPSGGIFNNKADLYAEIITDGNPSRKTEMIRKTWSPQWNENFDILVTPTSRIEFRIFNRQTFKSDSLMGHCLIFINKLGQDAHNFDFRNLEKTFDLMIDHKGKTGVIEVIFNGIDSNNLRLGKSVFSLTNDI